MKNLEENKDKQLNLGVVSRSVWVVQNRQSGMVECIFRTKEDAEECIKGLKHYVINEVRVM